MKRRSPTRALVGLAAAGLVALFGVTANAQQNIYTNVDGLGSNAGPTLNPGGTGQLLYAGLYNVNSIGGDAQHNNIQLLNTSTNDDSLPQCTQAQIAAGVPGDYCYNPAGGLLVKIRFRDGIDSKELLDIVVPLSCGDVWAGSVSMGADSVPQLSSTYPMYDALATNAIEDPIITKPTGTIPFATPAGVTDGGLHRGYIEIIAMEGLACEPDAGELSLDGVDTWTRNYFGPDNTLAGEVFLVRAAQGVSHAYNMTAISRFSTNGLSLAGSSLIGNESPNADDCGVDELIVAGQCVSAVSQALSKSRVSAQYDIDPVTAGWTNLVITLPNKHLYCGDLLLPDPPFECKAWGEEVHPTIYDRWENFHEPDIIIEECEVSPCTPPEVVPDKDYLACEVNIIDILPDGVGNDLGCLNVWNQGPDFLTPAGWVTVDLVHAPDGTVLHEEVFSPAVSKLNVLGVDSLGYRGLPAIAMVLQEYTNDNTAAGSTYGNTVPAITAQELYIGAHS